jgi:hypothetical protein
MPDELFMRELFNVNRFFVRLMTRRTLTYRVISVASGTEPSPNRQKSVATFGTCLRSVRGSHGGPVRHYTRSLTSLTPTSSFWETVRRFERSEQGRP